MSKEKEQYVEIHTLERFLGGIPITVFSFCVILSVGILGSFTENPSFYKTAPVLAAIAVMGIIVLFFVGLIGAAWGLFYMVEKEKVPVKEKEKVPVKEKEKVPVKEKESDTDES